MPLKALLMLVLGLVLIAASYLLTRPPAPEPTGEEAKTEVSLPEEVRRKQFFEEQVAPALDEASNRNEEAIKQAKSSLDVTFGRYRQGIPSYTDKITSFLTQLHIAGAGALDMVSDGDGKTKLASAVFTNTVFSEKQLEKDLVAIVQQFESDLQAHQNILLASVATRLKKADFPAPVLFVDGRAQVTQGHNKLVDFTRTSAASSGPISATAFAGGFITGWAAQEMVSALLARVAAQLAARIATATGGAVVGGATAGGAAGTGVAPGLGTVVGIGTGIVVGFIVEHWMSERFREKLAIQCNSLLDDIETQIWSDPRKGLHTSFAVAAQEAKSRNEQTMLRLIALKTTSP